LLSLRQAGALVGGMSPRQRLIAGGGVLAVIVFMAVFVLRVGQPAYTTLYSGLQPADAQQVTTQLAALGISYQTSTDGSGVSVPADQLDRARLALAAQGLPHSGQLGFEVFDKTNWSGSDFAEQVNYQRALEGELERTIETIHDVRSARVHITMAHDSLFTSDQRPAKAAVLLSLKNGALDPDMVNAIRHLVASSVDHLAPQNVSVLDADGQIALADAGAQQGTLEKTLAAKIVATLAPIVGAQHVRASVSVAYDPTSSDDTQETYDPAATVVTSSQRTSSGGAAVAEASGVPGTTSNLPTAQAPGTNFKSQLGLSGTPGQVSESQTYAVSRSVNHIVRPPDTIQRVTAAVLLDNAVTTVTRNGKTVTESVPRSAQEMQQMQALAAAAIGLNPQRGDVLTVSNLPFLESPSGPAAAPAAPAAPAAWWQRLPFPWQWMAAGLCGLLLCLLLAGTLRRRRGAPAAAAAKTAAGAQLGAGEAMAPVQRSSEPQEVEHEVVNITELLEADPEITPPEVKQVLQLKARLADRVKKEPAIASRLVQVWMSKRREEAL
jgi:flagellar M-ring protein FliF